MNKMDWNVRVLKPSPSMNEDTIKVCGTYQRAVNIAHRAFKATGRSVSVEHGMYSYHRISGYTKRVEWERNFNSGVQYRESYA